MFQEYTKQYYNIEDKEILRLSLDDKICQTKTKVITEEGINIKLPKGIEHYYVMEMMDQPDAVNRALGNGARIQQVSSMVKLGGLESHHSELIQIESLLIAACGTSYLAGKYAEELMR